ncbi:sulfatase family protein [Botrimarina hoheduenensis]|uniref:Arylsulfatase n=1 Tax=Botrimarina hoheduenensis TaxID=2528000 RepID=A0A5C5VRU5_9BACT|nr:sulfatase [Botrimarina hoheduenensis]TWT40645.1 Arylsulfatase [Botrimarina hoheduenensis]
MMNPSAFTRHALRVFSTLVALTAGAVACRAAEQPNVLFIMSDDHAAQAVGAYGGRLSALDPTPTLDRLAAEGVRFSNCFNSNSICVPSRATLLTGQYSHRNGVLTLNGALPAPRQALAHAVNAAGYDTAMIGKWHLKAEPGAFNHYCVLKGQGKYFNPTFRVRGPNPWPENTIRPSDRAYDSIHSSDAITDQSIAWLRGRKSEKPFFLMHHFKAPHDNFENAERYDWLFNDATIPEPPTLYERGEHGPAGRAAYGTSVSRRNTRRNMGHHMATPESLSDREYTAETYQRYLKKYLRCVRGVDDNIARLLECLDGLGQLENTIVVYTSDQGFMLGEHDYIDKRWGYEESMRMPLIVWRPGRFSEGEVRDELVTNVDFLPTLVEMVGGDASPIEHQGESLVPLLGGGDPPEWRDAVYYRYWMHMTHHDVPAHYGVRTADHKLVYFYGLPLDAPGALPDPTPAHWELYDLRSDPDEERNVIDDPAYRDVADRLKARLLELKEEVGDTDEGHPALMKVREATW